MQDFFAFWVFIYINHVFIIIIGLEFVELQVED